MIANCHAGWSASTRTVLALPPIGTAVSPFTAMSPKLHSCIHSFSPALLVGWNAGGSMCQPAQCWHNRQGESQSCQT